jgi:hypothetical protein
MTKTLATLINEIFPDGRIYEYYLQRLRLVLSTKARPLEVKEIRDIPLPEKPDGFPSIEVVIRIQGLTLNNPVTGRPMLPGAKFKAYFESWPMQEDFLVWFGQYIGESIPADSPEASLKKRFETIKEGRPSCLPPRADLLLVYSKLVRQLQTVKDWLRARPIGNRGRTQADQKTFLKEAPQDSFWWLYLVERGDLSLEQIETNTPKSTAVSVLCLHYGVEEDAIRSRLFRAEK